MTSTHESRSEVALPPLAAFGLCGTAGVLSAAIVLGSRSVASAVSGPFVWWDVSLVYVLCAVPAAAQLAAGVKRRISATAVLVAAIVVLWLAWQALAINAGQAITAAVWRSLQALGLALAASLLVAAAVRRPLRPALGSNWRSAAATVALCLAFVWLIPAAYASTRVRHHIGRLQQLLDEARFAESLRLAHALHAFDPSLRLAGIPPSPGQQLPLTSLVRMLDERVRQLEDRVSRPLPSDAPDNARLGRAEELSMLGREREAAVLLTPLAERRPADPRACELLGAIYETQEDFPAARAAFERAASLWEAQPPSAERTGGLAQAVRGIAYAERKLGRYAAAEAAYQKLLTISPTADTHFLLAKFYEDTQQAGAARRHARRAMELAPQDYAAPGRDLIDALAVRHFGCLPVYLQERAEEL
jgi:tetratricopeptide (TPR) repeat protein